MLRATREALMGDLVDVFSTPIQTFCTLSRSMQNVLINKRGYSVQKILVCIPTGKGHFPIVVR